MELYQFPTPDCMHFQGTESTDWRILLPLLVKIHAKTKLLPEKGEPPLLERNGGRKSPWKILEAVRAIEMHMELSCIAIGILQRLFSRFIEKVSSSQISYQRTPSRRRVLENTLIHFFRKHFSLFRTKTLIINADIVLATGRIRKTVGFSSFLVIQTDKKAENHSISIRDNWDTWSRFP